MSKKYPGLLTVSVTQEDIDHGEPYSDSACPIANALGRMGYASPSVQTGRLRVLVGSRQAIQYMLFGKALSFANAFDDAPSRSKPVTLELRRIA